MSLDLGVDELLTTTRSVRKRLDFDRVVPREVLMECLDLALQAPNAANTQNWRWIFVEDDKKKHALAEIYRGNLGDPSVRAQLPTAGERSNREIALSGRYLLEHLQDAPILMIPCQRGRVEQCDSGAIAGFWASLMPAVWSFCLALRSRALGTCWTTLHLHGDGERKAAELLGIPFTEISQAGLLPIAYTKGTEFKRAARLPATDVSLFDHW